MQYSVIEKKHLVKPIFHTWNWLHVFALSSRSFIHCVYSINYLLTSVNALVWALNYLLFLLDDM